MPTEGFEKGKIYFKSKDDEEYKETKQRYIQECFARLNLN